MANVDWNAAAYDKVADPMFLWGSENLVKLNLRGNERVLDAGCGSGRLTEVLLQKLPEGTVVALDASPKMLEQARAKLASHGARVEFIAASLEEFTLATPVDGVFSNAVFHWVPDHDKMFRALHRALKPEGWLVAEFGGMGNLARALRRAQNLAESAAFRGQFAEFEAGPHFENAADTRRRMEAAGFRVQECALLNRTARFSTGERFASFMENVVLRQPIAQLNAEQRRAYLGELARQTLAAEGEYMLDYVRVQVRATA